MEDFPLLILFFIIYLIAGSSGKKNRKGAAGQSGPMRTRRQGEQYDRRADRRDRLTKEGFQTVFSPSVSQPKQSCDERSMHLHEVTNEDMQHAAEGEDPCHAGGVRNTIQQASDYQTEEQDTLRAQDILRGVIMSEVLTRPYERKALQRSRQRTNGY